MGSCYGIFTLPEKYITGCGRKNFRGQVPFESYSKLFLDFVI
jgi:hypothetical protein